ncbi:ABC transporter permease [Parasphaerochaeta coccoides]|uniref:Nucleoside ABC transporter membrane protein n=1 Tax=Parasphaerochaeta coccoides (strain ATCC BAA-1237 / DSM 17374 / SPN1) TaxID=760011 RepID=F4GKD4_PARC1|nr:ABC transporter permease [Parasphaerochaeta coccoides]AEC02330.1 nucleoside ABC transporter membrane protein [Parasphaerochaeta coccoides DSM 17374]
MNLFFNAIPSILMIVSPILIVAIGGMICERSGVVNIALEGLMGLGACATASAHVLMETAGMGAPSIWLALLIGSLVGMLFSVIHAFASINLKANQTISGTGINLLADGVTIFAAQVLFSADRTRGFRMGMQTDALGIYPTVYIAIGVVILSWFVLYRLPFGMHLRACGEHPSAADSVGINVKGIRYFGVLTSGFLAGLAGGCIVLTQTIQYTSNTINGRGFIALAAVSFGRWRPAGVAAAALLFGVAQALYLFTGGIPALKALPSEVFNIMPYLITLIALVVFSGKNYAPLASGQPYEKGAS